MPRKIIDSFIFFNELSTLEVRLNELYETVDWFVLVEAPQTFSGKPKPLHFGDNQQRFARFAKKIVHYVLDDFDDCTNAWDREFKQRNAIVDAIEHVPGITQQDIVLVSDADEIPDPAFLNQVPFDDDTIFVFNQRFFYYDFTCENPNGWPGTMSIPYGYFTGIDLNHLRKSRNRRADERVRYIPEFHSEVRHGGWHCSCFGGVERIIRKLESYSHQRFNKPRFKDPAIINELIRDKKDLVFRTKSKYRLNANDQENDPYLPRHWRLIYE